MTEQEFCMDLWRDMCGLPPIEHDPIPSYEVLKESEWSPEFERLMRNRLIMACFRYDSYFNRRRNPIYKIFNWADAAIKKLQRYLHTGNTENLVDAANYAMTEFMWGHHLNKHFRAQDDSEHARRLK